MAQLAIAAPEWLTLTTGTNISAKRMQDCLNWHGQYKDSSEITILYILVNPPPLPTTYFDGQTLF